MRDIPKILFLGDMMPGENVYHIGRGIRTKYGHDYSHFIPEHIKGQLLNDIDVVVYNFEYSLVPNDFDFNDFEASIYVSTLESLKIIPDHVIKVVNIANNHFWEKGASRTKYTINALKEHGFFVAGENGKPTIVEIKGQRLLFWGTSLIDWDVPVFTATYNDLLDKIELPKEKGCDDVWVMSIHWGTEFITYPNRNQVELAHQLVDRGGDIIHGHHPHVFQPIERYNNGLVMYSMGNFVFDENFSIETQKSYCVKIAIDAGLPCECLLIKNRNYQPVSIRPLSEQSLAFIDGAYWSERKKKLVSKTYNICRKIEFLFHIWENNFYIYKSMKNRKKQL